MNQIVCLSDRPWSSALTRTQQILARLKGARVLYFESSPGPQRGRLSTQAKKARPNVLVYTLPYSFRPGGLHGLRCRARLRKAVNFISEKLERHAFRDPVLWITHPRYSAISDYLSYRRLIYDCDEYYPPSIARPEGALAHSADVVFAASAGLVDRLSPCNRNIALIPNGVNYPMFSRAEFDVPPELQGVSGPILGWAGEITPQLDLSPVEYAAGEHPEWTFALAGGVGQNPRLGFLRELPNVRLLGRRPMSELPDYLGCFDVCLHLISAGDEDNDVIPARIYEYLSTGKPIVSMLYEDQIEDYPDVIYGAHTMQEFSLLCARALDESPGYVSQRRRDYGKAAAWSARAAEVKRILEGLGLY